MKHTIHSLFSDVIVFTPNVYGDERGYFLESYNQNIKDILNVDFLQDNHSKSHKYVFRGLHYHYNKPMGKLLRVINGKGIGVFGRKDREVSRQAFCGYNWGIKGFV